jgi:hypothetical protein
MQDPSLVRFRKVVAGSLAHLDARRQEINDLNVFPVADGDTGDNMALTLRAVLEEIDRLLARPEGSLDEIGRDELTEAIARAALLGARGNSGVILSQLIRGAAEELVSRPGELVDPILVGAAMARAAQRAYDSVRQPAEGTMLTVMREMAQRIALELPTVPNARLGSEAPDACRTSSSPRSSSGRSWPGRPPCAAAPSCCPSSRRPGSSTRAATRSRSSSPGSWRRCAGPRARRSRATPPRCASPTRSTSRARTGTARTSR